MHFQKIFPIFAKEGPFCLFMSDMKRRIYFKDILTHCYQRSADDGVLFYTYGDHLVYFTLYCTLARKHGIQVLSLCQMPDHLHDSIRAKRKEDMSHFKREVNTFFSRQWNDWGCTKGHVLRKRYGWAQKFGDKKGRSNLVYVGNNPVERRLVEKAEDYRWNYLAYASSDHPFSKKLVIRDARWPLQKAIKEVKAQFKAGKPLNYALLQRLFKPLTREEGLQLTDFIITTYNCIDYKAANQFFDNGEDMISSMHATTGSEHDINEVFIGKSDVPYNQLTRFLLENRLVEDIHDILSMTTEEKFDLFLRLRPHTEAMDEQIAKFLHMPLTTASNGNC